MTQAQQAAYMAGILDALGLFQVRRVQERDLAKVALHSTNGPLLEWVGAATGTKITEVKRNYARYGCDEHCNEKHIHVNHSSLRWSVTGVRATILIHSVLPHLVLQSETAEQVLDATADAPYRKPTAEAMAALGWTLPTWMKAEVGS